MAGGPNNLERSLLPVLVGKVPTASPGFALSMPAGALVRFVCDGLGVAEPEDLGAIPVADGGQ